MVWSVAKPNVVSTTSITSEVGACNSQAQRLHKRNLHYHCHTARVPLNTPSMDNFGKITAFGKNISYARANPGTGQCGLLTQL